MSFVVNTTEKSPGLRGSPYMNSQRKLTKMAAALGMLALLAAAQSEAAPGNGAGSEGSLAFVAEANLEYGGDNVAEVFFTNGESQHVKTGQGVTLALGAHFRPAASAWDFSATAGYKFVTTAAKNADLGIDRVVLKFTGSYTFPNEWWIGAGPVWHTNTKFNGDGFLPDVEFDDAVGAQVGIGWRWIGLTYTSMDYDSDLTGKLDASNIGAAFAWKF